MDLLSLVMQPMLQIMFKSLIGLYPLVLQSVKFGFDELAQLGFASKSKC